MRQTVFLLMVWLALVLPSVAAAGRHRPAQEMQDSLLVQAVQAYLGARYGQAVALLRSIPFDSLSAAGAYYLGASHAALNDFAPALRALRLATSLAPANTGYRFQLARFLAGGGLVAEARQEYLTILTVDSQFVPALFNLGMIAYEKRDYADAASYFLRVVENNPRDFLALYRLGSCYSNLDSTDLARQYLAASLTLNSTYGPSLALLASLYYRQSDYRQALRLHRIATREYPEQPEYWYNQGLCLEKFEDYIGAVECHRRAIALDSSNSLYFAHLGQVYFDLRRFDSSATAYANAVQLDDENPVLYLNLGLAFARMGALDSAEQAFKKAIAAHDPAQIARVYNQLGALYSMRERFRSARTAYMKALQYEPGNLEALFYYAVTLDRLKEYVGARSAYNKYIARADRDPAQDEKVKLAKQRVEKLR